PRTRCGCPILVAGERPRRRSPPTGLPPGCVSQADLGPRPGVSRFALFTPSAVKRRRFTETRETPETTWRILLRSDTITGRQYQEGRGGHAARQGRGERSFGTAQRRRVKELRLAGETPAGAGA